MTMAKPVTMSPTATCLLSILRWERERPEVVTVDEVVKRLGMPRERVKQAFRDLYELGLVNVEYAGEE
jgi:Mn-dependent DtxR family transcriptional regulator